MEARKLLAKISDSEALESLKCHERFVRTEQTNLTPTAGKENKDYTTSIFELLNYSLIRLVITKATRSKQKKQKKQRSLFSHFVR